MISLDHRFTSDPLRSRFPFGRKTQLRRRYDWDAQMYFNRVQAAGTELSMLDRSNISAFVRGLKALGLFEPLLEGWLLRSGHNVGTGSTVLGLRGFSGTLINGPTWGSTGISFTGTQRLDATSMTPFPAAPCSCLIVGGINWNTAVVNSVRFGHAGLSGGRVFRIGTALAAGDQNWFSNLTLVGSVNFLGTETAVPSSGLNVLQFAQQTPTTAVARINNTDWTTLNYQNWDSGFNSGLVTVVGSQGGPGIFTGSAVLFFGADLSPLFVKLQTLVKSTIGSDLSLP